MNPDQLELPILGLPAPVTEIPEWMRIVSRLFSSPSLPQKKAALRTLAVMSSIRDRRRDLSLAFSFADGEYWTGIPNDVLEAQARLGLAGNEHAVLLVLYERCYRMNPGKVEWVFLSSEQVATLTGLHRRTVRNVLDVLAELHIIRLRFRGRGRRRMIRIADPAEWVKKSSSSRRENAPTLRIAK